MATTAPLLPPPPSPLAITTLPALPFELDLSCPLPLPARPSRSSAQFASEWAFPIAGPSTYADEDLPTFIRRRYLETVYLPELLFPIAGLLADLGRAAAAHGDALDPHVLALLLSLSDIEARHRRTLRSVLSAAMSAVETTGSIVNQAAAAGLDAAERDVLATAVDMRLRSRVVSEGKRGLPLKDLADELERREVLVQLVLLLFYRGRNPPPTKEEKKERDGEKSKAKDRDQDEEKASGRDKKRRKSSRSSLALTPPPPSPPHEAPDVALELLADRIGVWLAVAELGIGLGAEPSLAALSLSSSAAPKPTDERTVSAILKRFWASVLVPTFLPREATFLGSFHVKVFGEPMPADLVPVKKPRKQKVTRRLEVDDRDRDSHGRAHAKLQRTSSSRAPLAEDRRDRERERERERERQERDRTMEREMSLSSVSSRFSRSASMDPSRASTGTTSKATPVVRAPSGKDLFKGRQVGLLRRSSSLIAPNRANATVAADDGSKAAASGLLGRRAAGESLRRHESQAAVESRSLARAETLIFATPAKGKPKHVSGAGLGGTSSGSVGGGRHHSLLFGQFVGGAVPPTPIREEPSSAERSTQRSARSHVSETPTTARRGAGAGAQVGAGVAETPVARRVLETPRAGGSGSGSGLGRGAAGTMLSYGDVDEEEDDDDEDEYAYASVCYGDEDDLGGLMVPTDDEDDGPDEQRPAGEQGGGRGQGLLGAFVPETPRK